MRVVLTGAHGFLGWHTRLRLHALGHDVVPVGRADWDALGAVVRGADAVVHVAGVNRGDDTDVEQGNVRLARDLAAALPGASAGVRVVYADSIQAGNGTPYGTGKATAAEVLAHATAQVGGSMCDVLLPNLFGEHGRPAYNSFVATFVHEVLQDRAPAVEDREITLLHAQGAAQALVEALGPQVGGRAEPAGTPTTVADVLVTLQRLDAVYRTGDMPALTTPLDRDLFNTLRAASFSERQPIRLTPRSDARGHLVEVVRAHGGEGQTFVSSTRPGVTRGEHFHLRKVERFVVVGGEARISLRRVFDRAVVSFDVDGTDPVAIDMPTGWAHNITNVGQGDLTTLFWTNELFDPAAPDTWPEPVGHHPEEEPTC